MHIPKNLSQLLKRKGIQPNTPYTGVVIDNNDPSKAYRLRVRIEGIFDHLEDDELPWAAPVSGQPNGIAGGKGMGVGRTQAVSIPEADSMVTLFFNQNGDPMQPTYSKDLPIPLDKISPEFQKNYPNRQGYVLPSGFTFIHDRKTKESFLETPGDANLTIMGDVNLNVIGNIQAKAMSSKGSLPSYISSAPERLIGKLDPNPSKKIAFEGLHGGESGNIHFEASENITFKAGQNFKVDAGQEIEEKAGTNYKQTAGRNMSHKAGSKVDIKAGGKLTAKGSAIYLN